MAQDTRRGPTSDKTSGPGASDAEGEEAERISGEYRFVYTEIARITTVRKSVPARKPEPAVAPPVSKDDSSSSEPEVG